MGSGPGGEEFSVLKLRISAALSLPVADTWEGVKGEPVVDVLFRVAPLI